MLVALAFNHFRRDNDIDYVNGNGKNDANEHAEPHFNEVLQFGQLTTDALLKLETTCQYAENQSNHTCDVDPRRVSVFDGSIISN